MSTGIPALWLTFHTAEPEASFRQVNPGSGAVIPLSHKSLEHKGTRWNASLFVIPDSSNDARSLGISLLENRPQGLIRLALTEVQEDIDMLYGRTDDPESDSALMQLIEYVESDPVEAPDYYQCQHEVSGPAMGSCWDSGVVSRFIGFERREVLWSSPETPDWDLVHVIGAKFWRMPQMFIATRRAFDVEAKSAGRGTGAEVIKRWDSQRRKQMARARQHETTSRRSALLAEKLPARARRG
ncbi:MAG: hypothetical protein AAGE43_02995 [Pseudomonadota bacterium]